jgi:DNA-binding PadR family transcriptional regulator
MRALKYAILGLLIKRPMTGYEIAKEFGYELAEFWYANHSQIYPELKKLTSEGHVVFNIEISGDILEAKRYTITEKGIKDFTQWILKDENLQRTPKDIFRLRMYFSNNLEVSSRIHLLENQRLQHVSRLNTLEKIFEQYREVPSASSDRFGDFLVLRGAIMREKNYIAWIDECIMYSKENPQTSQN